MELSHGDIKSVQGDSGHATANLVTNYMHTCLIPSVRKIEDVINALKESPELAEQLKELLK